MPIHTNKSTTEVYATKEDVAKEAVQNASVASATVQEGKQEFYSAEQKPAFDQQFTSNTFQQVFGANVSGTPEQQISGLADVFFKPISTGNLNQRISGVQDVFKQYYLDNAEVNPNAMQVDFIPAPGNKIGHFYGGLIVALPIKTMTGSQQVGAHLVIVETEFKQQPQTEVMNGQTFSIPSTAGNTVSQMTLESVDRLVKAHYGDNNLQVVDGGFSVVPSEVQLTDTFILHQVVENAAEAAYSRLQMFNISQVTDEGVILASAAHSNNLNLVANIEEKPQQQHTTNGSKIRSDFCIRTSIVANQTQNTQIQQAALDLGQVNVYCTPRYAAPRQVMLANGEWGMQSTAHYYNQVVIKEFRTGPQIRLSIGATLLLLATTGLLVNNGVWKRAYIPNLHIPAGQLDTHDIGAFGYEVPFLNPTNRPEMVPTKTAEFTSEAFERYMTTLFHNEIMYTIDVPDGHHILGLFLSEASGNTSARQIIFGILNAMTKGNFEKIWNNLGENMFIQTGERVMEGYYVQSSDGTKQPLDNIDHLAMLNLVNGDAKFVREWEEFYGNAPEVIRMSKRYEIIQTFADDKAEVKSYSSRILVNPKFMEALITAVKAAGLFPEVNSALGRTNTYARPTADQFANMVVNPMLIPNLFATNNQNYFGNANAGWAQQPFMRHPWGAM